MCMPFQIKSLTGKSVVLHDCARLLTSTHSLSLTRSHSLSLSHTFPSLPLATLPFTTFSKRHEKAMLERQSERKLQDERTRDLCKPRGLLPVVSCL